MAAGETHAVQAGIDTAILYRSPGYIRGTVRQRRQVSDGIYGASGAHGYQVFLHDDAFDCDEEDAFGVRGGLGISELGISELAS